MCLARTSQTAAFQNNSSREAEEEAAENEEEEEENEEEKGRVGTGMNTATRQRGANMLKAIEHLKAGVGRVSNTARTSDGDVSAMCTGGRNGSSFASTSTNTSTGTSISISTDAGAGAGTGRSSRGKMISSPVTSLGSRFT